MLKVQPPQLNQNRKVEAPRALACATATYVAFNAGFQEDRDSTPFKGKLNVDAFSTKTAAKAAALFLRTCPEGYAAFKSVNVSIMRAAGTVVLIARDREEAKDRLKTAYIAFCGVASSKVDQFSNVSELTFACNLMNDQC
jgi:hypothetical protein